VDARRVTIKALGELESDLARVTRIRVVAAGKAAAGMASAAIDTLGDRIVEGVVTAAVAPGALPDGWQAFAAGHPYPTAASERAARAALGLARRVHDTELLLVCLSGGASAMLAVPAPGVPLDDKIRATQIMLRAGLDIASLNVVRRHLSAIKGGQLAALAPQTITLAISDVSGPHEDDASVIGSGPTAADPTTFQDALDILARHRLMDLPASVTAHLQAGAAGQVAGPVAPDDRRLSRSAYWIVASRHEAMRAAAEAARRLAYAVHVRHEAVVGEARHAAAIPFAEAGARARPLCDVTSGETTVHVRGEGRGGRNQEFAVAALEPLAQRAPAALASIGTDGVDGPTDAAGAMVDSTSWAALGAHARGLCDAALDANDAYPFLDRLGALVRSGPTGTNVGDLQVLLLP
jgi:glycerate-2-kinase